MMNEIIFTPMFAISEEFYPQPASKNIPDWYKNTNSYRHSNKYVFDETGGNQTIKKCMPVFDALTSGYTIKTHVDINVSLRDGSSYYEWPSYEPISFHVVDQAPLHPKKNNMPYPKINNPWSIQTKKGYSCLFIPPMHNPNGIFTIMPGIVDTDTHIIPVNFPFTLDDPHFEGLIPAGTPICQIIPFKRDSFSMKIGDSKQFQKVERANSIYRVNFINRYKNKFWNKKDYK